MSVSSLVRIEAQSGTALELAAGQALEIVDLEGRQVADVAIFRAEDVRESFSPGRTLDYNEAMSISTGATLYSNRSTPLMRIEQDDVGRHDYLLSPCSKRMFEILRGLNNHPSCLSNLTQSLCPYGVSEDDLHGTLNIFMNVEIGDRGRIAVRTPISKAGDRLVLRALTEVLVGLTACSSEHTNGGRCKPIGFRILPNR
ncbi:MAG: DUF1989 domain-containing protein [Candidatus Baltobacteraceae bacterium]